MDQKTKELAVAAVFTLLGVFLLGFRAGYRRCKADIAREQKRKLDAVWVDFA